MMVTHVPSRLLHVSSGIVFLIIQTRMLHYIKALFLQLTLYTEKVKTLFTSTLPGIQSKCYIKSVVSSIYTTYIEKV